MKTLAITGSSGSGKTTISKLFLKLDGTFLINTDELTRDMSRNDSKYLNEIVEFFGQDILDEFGNLNRKKLSFIIAKDSVAKNEINKITKRNIMPKLDELITKNTYKKLIVVDVPVLYENGLENYFNKVLAVVSNREEQIRRIGLRDGLIEEYAKLRLDMQLSDEFFVNNADFVIRNFEKNLDELFEEVKFIYSELVEK